VLRLLTANDSMLVGVHLYSTGQLLPPEYFRHVCGHALVAEESCGFDGGTSNPPVFSLRPLHWLLTPHCCRDTVSRATRARCNYMDIQ
jgi:hypothetical protein